MKSSLPIVLVLAGAVTMTACKKDTDNKPVASETPSGASTSPPAAAANERGTALVRVIDAVPAPAVDVVADDHPVATNVTYPTVTPYTEVPASKEAFKVKVAGADAILAENSEAIASGRHYSLIAFPGKESDKVDVKVIADDIAVPENRKVRLRVINAAADVEQVDVVGRSSKDTLFDDIDFREASGYKEVDPGDIGALEVRSQDGKRVLAQPTVAIEPGKSYTVVVTGKASGNPSLRALVIEDKIVAQANTN